MTKLCLALASPRISVAQPSLKGSASALVMKRYKSLLKDRKWRFIRQSSPPTRPETVVQLIASSI